MRVNFCGADIRGANFSKANLRGANFSLARAGLQHYWVIGLVIFSFLLSLVSGFISAASGAYATKLLNNSLEQTFAGLLSLVVFAVFLIVSVYKGLVAASGCLVAALAVGAVVSVVLARVVAVAGAVAGAGVLATASAQW